MNEKLCDREQETAQLSLHARNVTHVVVVSARRLGKTSLVWRVLGDLESEGIIPVYVDMFSVTSKENLVEKLAAAVTKGIGKTLSTESFLKTIQHFFTRIIPSVEMKPDGISVSVKFDQSAPTHLLIGDILASLEKYTAEKKTKCLLVFDEFQEITELPDSKEIEGQLRESLQATRSIAAFFVGSRRRILEEMFTDKRRPFYKMTMLFKLGKIERALLAAYISERFATTGKICSRDLSTRIYDEVEGYTYYVQKLAHIVWDMCGDTVTDECVTESVKMLLDFEAGDFEGIWGNLGASEKRVLMAQAVEPTAQPYASAYLSRYGIAIGTMQKGIELLIKKDIIEVLPGGLHQPTDPLLKKWCRAQG
jgi:hypothetical protein